MNPKLQSVYDRVSLHLLTQGKPSLDAYGGCAYRGVNSTSCAVGCLIKDEFYRPGFEGRAVTDASVNSALNLSGIDVDKTMEKMLSALQRLHDNHLPGTWVTGIREIAGKFDLSTSIVDNFVGK